MIKCFYSDERSSKSWIVGSWSDIMLYKIVNTEINVYKKVSLLRVWCHCDMNTHETQQQIINKVQREVYNSLEKSLLNCTLL